MWQEISRIALLGTDQTGIPDALRVRLDELDLPPGADDAETLLVALAAAGQMRKAGQPLVRFAGDLPALPADGADARPVCRPASVRYLTAILSQNRTDVLFEFFALLREFGQQLPPEVLPELLERTQPGDSLVRELLQISGPRIRALAQYLPTLRARFADPDPEAWETGTETERVRFLHWLREHAPDSARELLLDVWAQEPTTARAALLATLRTHLDADDEELLDLALADGRREIYALAAELLALLPASAYAERMRDRADRLVQFDRGKWTIALPPPPTEAEAADAIRPNMATSRSGGTRANHLVQLLRAVDPDHWTDRFEQSPGQLAPGWARTDVAADALHGLTEAVVRFRRVAWAEPLLRVHLNQPTVDFLAERQLDALLGLLPAAACNELLRERLLAAGPDPLGPKHPLLRVLERQPHSLSENVAFLLIKPLQRLHPTVLPRTLAYYYTVLNNLALRVPASLYGRLDAGWDQDALRRTGAFPMVEQFMQTLLFRRDMRRTFGDSRD